MKLFLQMLIGIAGAVCIICLATTITLNSVFLYEADIDKYNLEQSAGLSKETILENYKAMVEYNNIGGPDELIFPSFGMSEGGKIHFEEVCGIFHAMEYALIISAVAACAGIIWAERKKLRRYMLFISVFTVALPASAGIFAAVSWDTFFVGFHRLVFNNDYWIFDERLDPVITILPDGFFLDCVIMIAAIALSAAAALAVIYALRNRKY